MNWCKSSSPVLDAACDIILRLRASSAIVVSVILHDSQLQICGASCFACGKPDVMSRET